MVWNRALIPLANMHFLGSVPKEFKLNPSFRVSILTAGLVSTIQAYNAALEK